MMVSRLATTLAFVLVASTSREAHAQSSTAPRTTRRHALAGCWRIDAARTLTLDGTNGRIESIDLIGFAASPVHSTLTWLPSEHLYFVDAPGATGLGNVTISLDARGAPSLVQWQRDHHRIMTREWQQQHHARHPMHVVARWTLTRCATP